MCVRVFREGQNCNDCLLKLAFFNVLWFVRLRDCKTYCLARFGNVSFGPSRSLVPFWSVLLEKDRTVRLFIEAGHFSVFLGL